MIQSIADGRKEDGNRSIADKIIKRLDELDQTIENNQGRWAWELLQNAKDSIAEDNERTVSVQIQLDENTVEFRHNGAHFTEQDVRGLINQISSKEIEEGHQTQKTGRFGTGFLTTHLLSRVIQIKGILQAADNNFYQFNFSLDRQGTTTAQLIPKIKNSWEEFDNSVKQIDAKYDKNGFNTSFCYQLETEKQKKVAKIGVEEFAKLIPFVLAFIPRIFRVEILDNTTNNIIIFEKNQELIDGFVVPISKNKNEKKTNIFILYASDDKVKIATELEETEKGYLVKSIEKFPKLFCDFPLIGSENFHFPVIVNSFFFNPLTERDGVWLKDSDHTQVKENQKLLQNAVELYKNLISKVSEGHFFDLYNLAETKMPSTNEKYFNEKWYKDFIQKPMREFIYKAKIVEIEGESSEKKTIEELWFPIKSFTKPVKEKIWQFVFDLSPNVVCKRTHLHNWSDIYWENGKTINYQILVNSIAKLENIHKLSQALKKSEDDTFDWLNLLGNFLLEDDSNLALFEKEARIIPNQNGIFNKKIDLYSDEIKDDELMDIIELLGEDWKDILRHDSINFGTYRSKNRKDIAVKITEKLKNLDNSSDDVVKAINLLSEWFENNPALAKDLFEQLYSKRAELFMNTIKDKESLYKVMRNCTDLSKLAQVVKAIGDNPKIIEILENAEVTKLLQEFNADNISDLKKMLISAQNISKISITQETLLSLGVTSIEELEDALKDKNIAAQFIHTSTPTLQMFLSVQRLIKRAKDNVLQHLKILPEYDCSECEELATTVLGGIKKDGLPIYVVVRPSDNREVIVYYSSEKDTLDNPYAELWIDNGVDKPRHLTLGKILKTTGINRIPV
jgi:arsenate reductase-like glutaredoxin family protein